MLLIATLFEMLWIDTHLLRGLSVLLGIHLSVLAQQSIQNLTSLDVVTAKLAHQVRDRLLRRTIPFPLLSASLIDIKGRSASSVS